MAAIDSLLAELNERTLAQRVAILHDEARLRYMLRRNTVDSFAEFSEVITDYYNHHCRLVSGAPVPDAEALGCAKDILEHAYRRRHLDIAMAINDAVEGTNGGIRAILDLIADGLKEEFLRRHVRNVFDRYVTPNKWDEKVEIMRQFIQRCGPPFGSAIQADAPERYAFHYKDLVNDYVEALRKTSPAFRQL